MHSCICNYTLCPDAVRSMAVGHEKGMDLSVQPAPLHCQLVASDFQSRRYRLLSVYRLSHDVARFRQCSYRSRHTLAIAFFSHSVLVGILTGNPVCDRNDMVRFKSAADSTSLSHCFTKDILDSKECHIPFDGIVCFRMHTRMDRFSRSPDRESHRFHSCR